MKIKASTFLYFIFSFLYSQESYSPNWNFYELNKKKWNLGYFVGVNYFEFDIKLKKNTPLDIFIQSKPNMGFHAGLMSKFNFHPYLELIFSPGMYFLSRKLYLNKASKGSIQLKSTYLQLPLNLKFSGDAFYDMKPFIGMGIAYLMNLESNEKKRPSEVIMPFRRHNFSWEIEGGLGFYFSYFKMILSLKGLFFLKNEFIEKKIFI